LHVGVRGRTWAYVGARGRTWLSVGEYVSACVRVFMVEWVGEWVSALE
jgi:hypothetical protein